MTNPLTANSPVTDVPGIGPAAADRMTAETIRDVVFGHGYISVSDRYEDDAARAILRANVTVDDAPDGMDVSAEELNMRLYNSARGGVYYEGEDEATETPAEALFMKNHHRTVAIGTEFPGIVTPEYAVQKSAEYSEKFGDDPDMPNTFEGISVLTPTYTNMFTADEQRSMYADSDVYVYGTGTEGTPDSPTKGGVDTMVGVSHAEDIAALFGFESATCSAFRDSVHIAQDVGLCVSDPDSDSKVVIAPHTNDSRASCFDRQMGMMASALADLKEKAR